MVRRSRACSSCMGFCFNSVGVVGESNRYPGERISIAAH